jgi:hypothetical protein
MKYVVTWENRQSFTEQTQERSLSVLGKWSPPASVTFHQFVARVDGGGGFAIIETDDVEAMAQDVATFSAYFDMHVHPCLDMTDAARIEGAAIEFRHSVS